LKMNSIDGFGMAKKNETISQCVKDKLLSHSHWIRHIENDGHNLWQ
jgi:hypothetical protein